MNLETRSTVTLTMTGAEAHELAVFLYRQGAARESGDSGPYMAWSLLSELPEEKR